MDIVAPLKDQLNVILDLAKKQIDAAEPTTDTETLREILEAQRKHLGKLADFINHVIEVENSKFEGLLKTTQEKQQKIKQEIETVKRLSQIKPEPPVAPKKISRPAAKRSLATAEGATSRAASLLPRGTSSLPSRSQEETDLQTLNNMQKSLQAQVLELEKLSQSTLFPKDDPVARAVSLRLSN